MTTKKYQKLWSECLQIACSVCGAQPGEDCKSLSGSGKPASMFHAKGRMKDANVYYSRPA